MNISKKYTLQYLLLATTIAVSLINNSTFGPQTLAAFFFYIIVSNVFAAITTLVFITGEKKIQLSNPFPIIFLTFSALYYILLEKFTISTGTNIFLLYLASSVVLLISCSIFFGQNDSNAAGAYKIIALLAVLESILCILQFAGIQKSQNHLFKVTGSWVNPNVTAMFLALAIPAILFLFFLTKKYKKPYIILLIIVCIALVLLKCRTAFIGGALASIIIFNKQYGLLQTFKNKYSATKKWLLGSLAIVLLLLAAFILYVSKQSSADGRKLIWKISGELIAEKPLTGYGYGNFEKPYNLTQANYFAADKGNAAEKKIASFVLRAYNDFLQYTIEGGIIGFLLFIGLLLSLLIPSIKKKEVNSEKKVSLNITAFAGVAAFSIMSIFNFTVQAIPVMCLFIIYAAVIVTFGEPFNFPFFKISQRIIIIPIGLSAIVLCIITISFALAFRDVKNSNDLLIQNDPGAAIELLQPLERKLIRSQYYLQTYGTALNMQKSYLPAIDKFSKAYAFTSNPDLIIKLANCYYSVGKFDSAVDNFNIAKNIQPNRITPLFGLMNTYRAMNDTSNAIEIAKAIIIMQPKGNSKMVDYYKRSARGILDLFNSKD